MDKGMIVDKRLIGVVEKFHVYRVDRRDNPGQKHHGCEYFVLDLTHDPFAMAALAAYAAACECEYPQLSADLKGKVNLAKNSPAESRRFQPEDGK
jgi:hypothetical protein